jgi:putative phosphoesterase
VRPIAVQDATPPDRIAPSEAAPQSVRIGVLSDNHGYLDPMVLELFAGVVHIIHAGDIMDAAILSALETVAPLTAVAGNLDTGALADRLPREASGEIAGVRFLVGHKPKRLLSRLSAGKIEGESPDLVVWGHTHVPSAAWIDGALYLNPGTASSPEEEDDGPTVAIVEIEATGLAVKFLPLQRRSEAREINRAARAASRP